MRGLLHGRRTRIGATLALLVVVAVVVLLVAGIGTSSPKASTNSSTASGATAVARRDLVETDTESGTLGYSKPQTVYNHISGTVTWLPGVGQTIKPGQTLFKVAGQPVLLMNGTTPAYRDLKSSDSAGQDILELNRNLVDLGFDPDGIVVDDTWQTATTAGVDAFQASLGETETGKLTLGKVVFLPGDQLVSTVEGTVGATEASDLQPSYGPEFASLEKPATTTPTTASSSPHKSSSKNKLTQLERMIQQLKAEITAIRASNGNHANNGNGNHGNSGNSGSGNSGSGNHGNGGSGNGGNGGGGGGAATAILQTTSTQLTVTVDLDASKQSEATVGEPVTVEMPAGNSVNGRITAVSPVASSSSSGNNGNNGNGNGNGNNGNGNGNSGNGSSGSTIPVTISLSGRQSGAGLDQASVSVNFAQAKANNVLSVPVTALLATGGGGYAVQEAVAPHHLIGVTTGLFAAGYVQISGTGIYPGLQVTDSQG